MLNASMNTPGTPRNAYALISSLAGQFLGAAGYGFLSPLPWQWTGDDREECSYLRGALQALVFCWAFLGLNLLLDYLLAPHFSATGRISAFWQLPHPVFLIQIPIMAMVGLFITRGERRDRERLLAQRELEAAKWALLRAQMSPHVLFNTLNALAELARRDPAATEQALLDLSEVFEQMLQVGGQPLVSILKERQILQRYLSIQALRLGDRLRVEWDWDPALDGFQTLPLLLQPLVENALKHGITACSQGGTVRIAGHRAAGFLKITIGNTGPAPGAPRPGATGLRNLEERLRLSYTGQARFHLERQGDWTLATLELPENPWN